MFFQDATGTAPTEADLKTGRDYAAVLKEIGTEFTKMQTPLAAASERFQNLTLNAENLNKTFVGTRQRLQEMLTAVNESVPRIAAMGGEYKDAAETIADIAAGSRKNIIATTKDVSELYAAGQLIGKNVKDIVNNFESAGISYSRISDKLTESIRYVQNVGLNSRVVMQDVVANTDKLSRFNFSEGVKGLTKMAAQASSLRFDMQETFKFAEDVLNPEKAVEYASAFQRLGVAIGDLGDPFALMNASINGPEGLQNNIIDVAKSFTYFDEQTKTFKINPQGILTLKSLEEETGLSAANMRKSALAAAEMDQKLGKINTTAFKIPVSEEDKKMIANIARMGEGEGADYEVSIKDERGNEYQRKLVELQEEDFKRLKEQQEKGPKTIEEIQRAQLNTADKMLAEFKHTNELISTSLFGLPGVMSKVEGGLEKLRKGTEAPRLTLQEKGFQEQVENTRKQLQEASKIKNDAERERTEEKITENFKNSIKELGKSFGGDMGSKFKVLVDGQSKITQDSLDGIMKQFNILTGSGGPNRQDIGTPRRAGEGQTGGVNYGILTAGSTTSQASTIDQLRNRAAGSTATTGYAKSSIEVDFKNPTININLNVPPGMDDRHLTEIVSNASGPLKQTLYKVVEDVAVSTGRSKKVGNTTA